MGAAGIAAADGERSRWRGLQSALRWVAGGVALFLLYANVVCLPGCMSRRLLAAMSTEQMVVDASRVRLRGIRSLAFRDVRVYRRGQLGFAGVAMDGLVVRLAPGYGRGAWVTVSSVDGWNMHVRMRQFNPAPETDTGGPYEPFTIGRSLNLPVRLRDVDMDGVWFSDLSFLVIATPGEVALRNLEAQMRGGKAGRMSGSMTLDTLEGRAGARVRTSIDPRRLAPIFEAQDLSALNHYLARFQFPKEAPHSRVSISHMIGQTNTLVSVRVLTRDASYYGVETRRLDGLVRLERTPEGGTLSISEVLVELPEGVGRGSMTYPFDSGLVTFETSGGLNPLTLLAFGGVSTAEVASVVAPMGQTRTDASGVLDLYGKGRSRITGRLHAEKVMLLDRLPVRNVNTDVSLVGSRLLATNVVAACAGGHASGWAALDGVLEEEGAERTTRLVCQLENAALEPLLQSLGMARDGIEGLLGGTCDLTIRRRGETRSQQGLVKVRVTKGRVFSLPLFGGFTRAMSELLPGLDFMVSQSEAKVDIEVADQRLHARRLVVQGDVLSLSGDGHYDIGGELDLGMQVKLMKEHTLVAKVLRVVTYPVSWLLEFQVAGPLDDPHWYPVNFSSDLFRKLGIVEERKTLGESGTD